MQELVFYFTKTQCIGSVQHMFLSLEFWIGQDVYFLVSFICLSILIILFFRNMCMFLSTFSLGYDWPVQQGSK